MWLLKAWLWPIPAYLVPTEPGPTSLRTMDEFGYSDLFLQSQDSDGGNRTIRNSRSF